MIPTRDGSTVQRDVGHRLAAGPDTEQHVPLELPCLFRRHDLRRVEPFHLAGDTHGQPVGSNVEIQSIPLRPACAASQVEGTSSPSGVTAPTPVTATRLIGQA